MISFVGRNDKLILNLMTLGASSNKSNLKFGMILIVGTSMKFVLVFREFLFGLVGGDH